MKRCPRCETEKPRSEFWRARGRKDGLQAYCKTCLKKEPSQHGERRRNYAREYRRQERSTPEGRARELARAAPKIELLREARSKPCTDCGREDLPWKVMELDHARGKKSFPLTANSARWVNIDRLRDEIAKCDPRCPNCHRLRHHNEREGIAA